ncbi:hypothetical protein RTCIAT899_PC08825 (plasmid) [Rhizobium tropici CIAT 899]|nr:hypothetical protein RTCIAT899_PC08825 [Rhizobium tropici CIAT 899]
MLNDAGRGAPHYGGCWSHFVANSMDRAWMLVDIAAFFQSSLNQLLPWDSTFSRKVY